MPNAPIDREALAELRERRFQARRLRLEADVHMPPELRALFLDRTLLNTKGQMTELHLANTSRISVLRSNRRIFDTRFEHPGVLPDMDATGSEGDERPNPLVERGRLLEWAFDDHRLIWNSTLKQLVLNESWRAGRKRKTPAERNRKYVLTHEDGRRARRGSRRPPGN